MKKLLIALIALTTLAIFVACNPAKDPVKDNLAIGNWEKTTIISEGEKLILFLEVRENKTATLTRNNYYADTDHIITFSGPWTATSISEGSFELESSSSETIKGTFKATSSSIVLTIDGFSETVELTKALK